MKLQSQFALAFMPTLLLSGIGTTWLAKRAVHRAILSAEVSRGEARLSETAGTVAEGLEAGNESLLLPGITALLAKEDAVYVMALDPLGRVLAHTNVLETGKTYLDEATRNSVTAKAPSYRELQMGDQRVLDIGWPVWSDSLKTTTSSEEFLLGAPSAGAIHRRLGTLRIGYSLDQVLATEARISRELTLLLVVTGALLLGLAIVLVRGVLRPVGKLLRATEDIAAGFYGATVAMPSATELAALARSFNRMSAILSETTVSKDFLDTILSNMRHPLIVLEGDSRIRMINRAALDLLEYPAEELLGQPFSTICAAADHVLDGVRHQSQMSDSQIEFLTRSKTAIPVSIAGSSFGEGEANYRGIIVVAQDMRERIKLEREMVQSGKLSAVGKLASGVAHEINNPLGVIMGFAEGILFDLKPGDPLEDPLRQIQRETIRCRDLVQALLTFSRVSRSEQEPMDLNETVESALSLIQAGARLHKIRLVKSLAPALPQILGTANQIQQVVINLANNALDAMVDQGTLTIQTALLTEGERLWVTLSVTDTGSGIPEDILPRIFEPFFTTKPVGKGTGLGLGLVHEIVQKHSGEIHVESRPGHTEFIVKFPVPKS
jgi:PAS domain S-box-containing protein